MVSKNLGRGLTEYKRVNYDVLIRQFSKFIAYSQYDKSKRVGRYMDKPNCASGEVLFGVDAFGKEHELMSIIDSSD